MPVCELAGGVVTAGWLGGVEGVVMRTGVTIWTGEALVVVGCIVTSAAACTWLAVVVVWGTVVMVVVLVVVVVAGRSSVGLAGVVDLCVTTAWLRLLSTCTAGVDADLFAPRRAPPPGGGAVFAAALCEPSLEATAAATPTAIAATSSAIQQPDASGPVECAGRS